MSLREYSALMREAGMTPPTTTTTPGGEDVTHVEVKLVHTFRLDEKWEKFCANVTTKTLDLSTSLLEPIKVLIYAAAASLLLVATAKLIQSISSSSTTTKGSDGGKGSEPPIRRDIDKQ
ncbi:hypothetical protein ACA910_000947 [Epithemia clementina (nom. ined.)]